MEKNVLILEDNNSAREMLAKCISEIDSNIVIYQASSFMEACSICMMYPIDVFLVDIILDKTEKGDVSGITFVEKLREIDRYRFTPVIFTTSLTDPKLYTFTNMHSFGYLEKPFDPENAKKMIKEALFYTTERKKEQNFYFRSNGIIFSLKSSEIVFVEIIKHKLYVQTVKERMEMSYKSCRDLMKEMGSTQFLQCSRSTIVNRDYIYAFDSTNRYLVLKDGYGSVVVGTTFVKKVESGF